MKRSFDQYEKPEALRLGRGRAGTGASPCSLPGSGDTACEPGFQAGVCDDNGSSATITCWESGSTATGSCQYDGGSPEGECFSAGNGYTGG